MIETPTRRAVLGAGIFAAGSLIRIDSSVAQASLPPTPACHDGDEATLRQTEGPFFKPSSPERAELLEAGMPGQPIELVGFVISRTCKPLAGALLDFWQADDKGRYDNSGFRLRGHQFSDAEGRYRLRSVVPGLRPTSPSKIWSIGRSDSPSETSGPSRTTGSDAPAKTSVPPAFE